MVYDCFASMLVSYSNIHFPFIMQFGVEVLHILSASHARAVDAEIVYPVSQMHVAFD